MIELDSTPISKDLFWPEVFWWLECLCKVNLFVQQENPFEIGCGNRVYLFHDPAFVFRNFRKFTSTLERWIPETPAAKNFSSLFKVFGVGARQAPLPQNLCFVCLPTVASHLLGEDWFWSAKGTTRPTDLNEFSKSFPIGGHFQSKSCHSRLLVFKMSFWSWFVGKNAGGILSLRCNVGYKRLAVCQHNNYNNVAFQCKIVATEIAVPIQFPSHPSWTLESFLSNFELQDLQGLTYGSGSSWSFWEVLLFPIQFGLNTIDKVEKVERSVDGN